MKAKRTKKRYAELFDNPQVMFGKPRVTLFPNGVNEIWIGNEKRTAGFRITAGEGPAGFSLTISKFVGDGELTALMAHGKDYRPINVDDLRDLSLCYYNHDEKSQAFKAWYLADSTDKANKEALAQRCKDLGVDNF